MCKWVDEFPAMHPRSSYVRVEHPPTSYVQPPAAEHRAPVCICQQGDDRPASPWWLCPAHGQATMTCSCTPHPYGDGPEDDCPVHGDPVLAADLAAAGGAISHFDC